MITKDQELRFATKQEIRIARINDPSPKSRLSNSKYIIKQIKQDQENEDKFFDDEMDYLETNQLEFEAEQASKLSTGY